MEKSFSYVLPRTEGEELAVDFYYSSVSARSAGADRALAKDLEPDWVSECLGEGFALANVRWYVWKDVEKVRLVDLARELLDGAKHDRAWLCAAREEGAGHDSLLSLSPERK